MLSAGEEYRGTAKICHELGKRLDLCRVDSVGLSVGLHRNYKLPNQQGYISATGGRLVFADSEFEVGWGESMYHVLTGMCSNYQVVIVTVLAH